MQKMVSFPAKTHWSAIRNHGKVIVHVCKNTVLCYMYTPLPSVESQTQPFQHVLSFPGSPSHSPTYWITGNNRMDRRWFGLPLPWWQVPSRGQQLWGQIWDLTRISWCGPWNILERGDRGRDMFHKHSYINQNEQMFVVWALVTSYTRMER